MGNHHKPANGSRNPARHLFDQTAHKITHHGLTISVRLILGLMSLIVVGTLLLMLPGVGANGRLTFAEASFTATSAFTVTGLSIITPATDLTLLGKIILLCMIQIGGVGFMFVAIILLQLLGRKILLGDRLALADSLGLGDSAEILKVLRRVLIGVLAVEAIGALLLFVRWLPYFEPATALGYAVFHAISAFCNAGFDLFNGATTVDGVPFEGIPTDTLSLLLMAALIIIGGLGIPVIADLITYRQRRKLAVNTRLTLSVVLALTLLGWVALLLSEGLNGGLANEPLHRQIVRSFFQSVSNRTAGFASLPQFTALQPASLIVIMSMMFIGCAPASMGGGVTTGTFSVLVLSLFGYASGQNQPTIWKRSIDTVTIQRAGAVLTLALTLLIVCTWLILVSHPDMSLEMALFEAVSAFATCGLSLGATAEMNGFGRIILMILMFWGRLGPLSVVIAITQRRRGTRHLIEYPQEQILIG